MRERLTGEQRIGKWLNEAQNKEEGPDLHEGNGSEMGFIFFMDCWGSNLFSFFNCFKNIRDNIRGKPDGFLGSVEIA